MQRFFNLMAKFFQRARIGSVEPGANVKLAVDGQEMTYNGRLTAH